MKTISLERIGYLNTLTLGEITLLDENDEILFSCFSMELPWINNEKNISCIPKGEYTLTLVKGTKKYNYPHFVINSVPNRMNVKMIISTTEKNNKGNIMVESSSIELEEGVYRLISKNKEAFEKLVSLAGDKVKLIII